MKNILSVVLFFLAAWLSAGEKEILICTAAGASAEIKKAAGTLADSLPLKALRKCGAAVDTVTQADSASLLSKEQFKTAAYNTLVIVGLKVQDPLLTKCWGHQAAIDTGKKQFYRLGYGTLSGDIGYVECDWNPFLYSNAVRTNKFTTLCIKISGTSEKGVLMAIEAFKKGLLNGIVTDGNIQREKQTLLDLDPLNDMPPQLPQNLTDDKFTAYLAGWTQPDASEYRAYLDWGDREPVKMWRIKYLANKVFDDVSGEAWVKGLHRLAYGNAVTIAEFASPEDVSMVLAGISKQNGAASATLGVVKVVAFNQPVDAAFKQSFGKIYYAPSGKYLIASSLPEKATAEIIGAVK